MKNKRVFVPKILGKDLLNIEIDNNTNYFLNQLGIREPISSNQKDASLLEVIFVPLLIFDKLGHRVGYGGGYYDKFLEKKELKNFTNIRKTNYKKYSKIRTRHKHRLDHN